MTESTDKPARQPLKFNAPVLAAMLLSLALAGAGAVIMTDFGQLFGIGKGVIVFYFRTHLAFMLAAVLLFAIGAVLNRKRRMLRAWMVAGVGLAVVISIASTKFVTPYIMFRSQQHSARYVSIQEARDSGYVAPDDVVYAVEHNGVARAFPRENIWQPHILGADYGGDEITLTYCVLTNLPVPYRSEIEGKPTNLKVLAQTNNNLLLWDTNSGEIIQQITSTCEFSKRRLEPLPVIEMKMSSFAALYPKGEVLHNPYTDPLERIIAAIMPLEDAHEGDSWMFDTAATHDTRLHSKAKIIGLASENASIAYTKDALRAAGIINTTFDGRPIALVHNAEHDTFLAFDRATDDGVVEVNAIDFFGNTPSDGKLERVFVYSGPMWAVWAHYYPDTELVQ